mmetsp:Transcript_34480/g.82136  ORF Transcript_34480/g.82136 Transcript_34480/m.82136 type:complete len:158 (+) Transcript_34480:742-1215(+)
MTSSQAVVMELGSDLAESLKCPVCFDLIKDAVIYPCSHNVCKSCTEQLLAMPDSKCPLCKQPAGRRDVRPNTGLSELAQINISQANEQVEVRRRKAEEAEVRRKAKEVEKAEVRPSALSPCPPPPSPPIYLRPLPPYLRPLPTHLRPLPSYLLPLPL